MKRKKTAVLMAVLVLAVAGARANNLVVKNVSVEGIDEETATIQFDISWENAWRDMDINHDAVWMFFKVLPESDTANAWQHAILEGSGHETGTGTPIEIIVPEDRVGLFVRMALEGHGDVDVKGVKVVWNYASNGLADIGTVRVQAMGTEMVYVPEGAFYVGSGDKHAMEFREGGGGTKPFAITSAGPIECGDEVGKLFVHGAGTMTVPGDYPNGYTAFYCMKYEITQGQYADFLNTLTEAQADNRYPDKHGSDRHTISGSFTNYSATARYRACNYLTALDGAAFADWSGLRPMTELEYEKACRGPLPPVTGEYAWGSTTITLTTSLTDDGKGTATADNGNCNYSWFRSGIPGPVRAGIYATTNSTREEAGASYWGIMELSGNLSEHAGHIGHSKGRNYNGLHGDGVLTVDRVMTGDGNADVPNWPLDREAHGYRGGGWRAIEDAPVSFRGFATTSPTDEYKKYYGYRAVRTAPSGVEP